MNKDGANTVVTAAKKPSLTTRISQKFWEGLEHGELVDKAIFLQIFILVVDIILYVLFYSLRNFNPFMTYINALHLSYLLAVLKFYIIFHALMLLSGILLKKLRRDVRFFTYSNISMAGLEICIIASFIPPDTLFTFLFVVLSSMFILIAFGPEIGRFALLLYGTIFMAVMILKIIGYFKFPSILLETVSLNDVLNDKVILIIVSVFLFVLLLLFGMPLIRIMTLVNKQSEKLKNQHQQVQRLSSKLSLYLPKLLVNLLERGEADVDRRHERRRLTIFL